MIKNEFMSNLKKPFPNEVFIDTIKGRHPANKILPIKTSSGWEWDAKRGYHFKNKCRLCDSSALLIFKESKDKPYDGNVFCEFSAPKALYRKNNISGILFEDRTILYDKVKELIVNNGINIDIAEIPVDFRVFDVTRIDLSFSFFPVDKTEQEEFLRLFKMMYHPYLKPGKLCKKDYDYPNAFAFTSNKLDIVLYDKAKEFGLEDIHMLRLEFRCKKPAKGFGVGSDYFDSVENSFKKGNKWLANKLERYNFCLPFVPEDEYIKAIIKCYKTKKAEHTTSSEAKPSYLTYKLPTLIKTVQEINSCGCHAYHSLNRIMYNDCLQLAKDAGVQILYTGLSYPISFIDNVCYHEEAEMLAEYASIPP